MAVSSYFCDSWDHYASAQIPEKWTANGTDCVIDTSGTKSRTGPGCLIIQSAAFGPLMNLDAQYQQFMVGTAYYSNAIADQNVIWFEDTSSGGIGQVRIWVTGAGAIRVTRGNDPFTTIIGQSAGNLFQFNTYNYITAKVFISNLATGSVYVQLNGVTVLSITGVVTSASGNNWIDRIRLMAAGGIPDCRHDDTALWTITDVAADPFPGAVRLYAETPDADIVVGWAPSLALAPNYTMVDEIPPNQDTDYVFSDVLATTDQYRYQLTGPPSGTSIIAVQHVLDAKLAAAGSRSVGSVAENLPAASSFALTTEYVMYCTQYDLNPATGQPWVDTDFPAAFGPQVTA